MEIPVSGVTIVIFAILCIIAISIVMIAKFSFARLRGEQLDDLESLSEEKKESLRRLYNRPDMFMNTCTFLILFFIIIMASFTGHYIDQAVDHIQLFIPIEEGGFWMWFIKIGVLGAFGVIVLLFGEIIPKGLGLSFPERYISATIPFVKVIGKIVYPFVWVSEKLGHLVLKAAKAPYRTEIDLVHTEEEIRMLVSRSHERGEIDQVEGELIDNVFDFVDRIAKEVMIPRQDVVCVYVQDEFDETMRIVSSTSHTRYPLCLEDKDHVIGLVHIKDLMERKEEASRDLRSIRRNILIIPEVMKLSVLLQYMRTRRIYQAVVVDEYGGMVGLVGLEDILEELVGDIQDEHETDLPATVEHPDGSYDFAGKVLVDEVEDRLDIDLDDVDEDTIGGLVFGMLGRTPVVGDAVTMEGYTFTITEMQGYRIERVHVEKAPEEVAPEGDE